MNRLHLTLLYIRRWIGYYLEGRASSLNAIVRLEQGFFHDLKGLFNKRLGLPVNKFKAGDSNPLIRDDILAGAQDLARKCREVRNELFAAFSPTRDLIRLYQNIYKLERLIVQADVSNIVGCLGEIQHACAKLYTKQVTASSFDLGTLLKSLVFTHHEAQHSQSGAIPVTFVTSDKRRSFRLPYTDYSTWSRVFSNVVINAIEATEAKCTDGTVAITLTFPESTKAEVTIADSGMGMDAETLASFGRRGFTRNKIQGQGLGINEDLIAFVSRSGHFKAESALGSGTTISVSIDSARVSGAQSTRGLLAPSVSQRLRLAASVAALALVLFSIISFSLQTLGNTPLPQIASTTLSEPHGIEPTAYTTITALDKRGDTLWSKTFFPNYIWETKPTGQCSPILADLVGDDRNELIIVTGIHPTKGPGQSGAVTCLSSDGGELWECSLGPRIERPIMDFSHPRDEGRFTARWLRVMTMVGGDKLVLAIACADYFPSQVLFLSNEGQVVAEYWHTGHLDALQTWFEIKELKNVVLYGQNNRMGWAPVILQAAPAQLYGQGAPFLDPVWPRANEENYYVFGRAWVDDSCAPGLVVRNHHQRHTTCILDANFERYPNRDGRPFDLRFRTDDGRTILLDEQFNLDTIIVDTAEFSKWWQTRSSAIPQPRKWHDVDLANLYGYRRYQGGKLVEDRITLHPERYDYSHWAP